MRLLESPLRGSWDLVVNNHADVDGLLSVFTLVEPELALGHRRTLVEAAEIGDFWAWGERPAQVLFQGLTLLMNEAKQEQSDPQSLYERCLARVPSLLEGDDEMQDRIHDGLAHLWTCIEHIDSGAIARQECGPRFVHYALRGELADDTRRALYVPEFNEAISDACVLWPQARARLDEQKVALTSVATQGGYYYDIWYPGYTWAETPHRWHPPGLTLAGSSNGYRYEFPPLSHALAELQSRERNPGTWRLVEEVEPFAEMLGRRYPVIASFVDEEPKPAASSLAPERVVDAVAKAFASK